MSESGNINHEDPIELEKDIQIEFSGAIYEGFVDTGREHIPFVAKCNGEEIIVEIESIFYTKYGMESVAEMLDDIRSYLEENYS